jgi:hypothetical protein
MRIGDAILHVKEILPEAGDFTARDAIIYSITEKRGFLMEW